LVHPEFRRAGTGRALMQRAEQAARGIGRTLLTLDTRAGDAGEALYRALGWQQAGRIPGYASDATGALHDTLLFYKGM
jgi:ribosomal protein S18 acetylase RimI-like enzyme